MMEKCTFMSQMCTFKSVRLWQKMYVYDTNVYGYVYKKVYAYEREKCTLMWEEVYVYEFIV